MIAPSNGSAKGTGEGSKDIVPENTKVAAEYNLRPIVSPTLSGLPLLLFTKILQLPIIGEFLLKNLKKKNNFGCAAKLVDDLHNDKVAGREDADGKKSGNVVMPLYFPLPEGEDGVQYKKHEELSKDFDLKTFIDSSPGTKKAEAEGLENSEPFRYWTIKDYLSKYQSGELTPYQVAKAIIKVVNDSNAASPPLNAVIAMNEEDVLEQALQSTQRYKDHKNNPEKSSLGILEGVPVAIKDEVDVKGYQTTMGTSFVGDLNGFAKEDCPPVEKLRKAGAIIIGKTNMHEFGIGTTGYNLAFGPTRNPYNVHHYPGGSSSGSAAAVASGLVPLALGLDGGGSIRIPATLCGVVGLKPSFRRIEMDLDLAPTVGYVGPIAVGVEDAAIGYAVMAKNQKNCVPVGPPVHLSTTRNCSNLSDVKIGIYDDYFNDADEEIVQTCSKLVQHLESLGAKVVKVTIPHLEEIKMAHLITILSEMASGAGQKYSSFIPKHGTPESKINFQIGTTLSSVEYLNAQKIRCYATEYLLSNVFSNVDVLVTPGTGCIAPPLKKSAEKCGESNLAQTAKLMRYMFQGNLCGIPGVVVPAGYCGGNGIGETKSDTDYKLPVSLQIQARHWEEDLILRVAKSCEDYVEREKPMIYYDIFDLASKESRE